MPKLITKNNIMKVSISNTFKRVAFSFVVAFIIAVITAWILGKVMTDGAAMGCGTGIGIGVLIVSWIKYDSWFGKLE